jgi:hypothetical protein
MSVILVVKGGGTGTCDYPLESQVLEGIAYDFGNRTGTLSGDPPADIDSAVKDYASSIETSVKDFPAPILGAETDKYYPADIEVIVPLMPPPLIGSTDA